MKLFISLVLLVGVVFSPNNNSQYDCLSYEPATVTLNGKITRKTFAGPPNYESIKKGDAPETYWILQLAKPVCVNGEEPEKNVSDIQLVLSEKQYAQYEGLLGKRVFVTGTLFHAETGHHHTDVLLKVRGIKVARQ